MAKEFSTSIFSYSTGLTFVSFVGTAAGISFIAYWVYEYAYYKYLNTKEQKQQAQGAGGRPATAVVQNQQFLDSPKFKEVKMPTPL